MSQSLPNEVRIYFIKGLPHGMYNYFIGGQRPGWNLSLVRVGDLVGDLARLIYSCLEIHN